MATTAAAATPTGAGDAAPPSEPIWGDDEKSAAASVGLLVEGGSLMMAAAAVSWGADDSGWAAFLFGSVGLLCFAGAGVVGLLLVVLVAISWGRESESTYFSDAGCAAALAGALGALLLLIGSIAAVGIVTEWHAGDGGGMVADWLMAAVCLPLAVVTLLVAAFYLGRWRRARSGRMPTWDSAALCISTTCCSECRDSASTPRENVGFRICWYCSACGVVALVTAAICAAYALVFGVAALFGSADGIAPAAVMSVLTVFCICLASITCACASFGFRCATNRGEEIATETAGPPV